jgi:hypothetical protein
MQLYIAEVLDNNDPDKKGKVQIYCAPIHHNIKKNSSDLLPWAQSATWETSWIPEVGDLIYIFFEKEEFYKNPFYIGRVNLSDKHNHNKQIGSITAEYPDVKYIQLANNVALGMSSKSNNAEISIYHPKAEIYIDNDGHTKLYFSDNKNKMDITSDGIVITDINNNVITMDSNGIKVSGGNAFEVTGTPDAPNGQGGFCALPGGTCLFTGAIITTNKITGIS